MLKVKFLQDYAMDGHVQKKWSIVSVDEDRALFLQTHQIAELVKASIGKHFGTGLATGLVVKSPEESQTGKPEKVPDELKFEPKPPTFSLDLEPTVLSTPLELKFEEPKAEEKK